MKKIWIAIIVVFIIISCGKTESGPTSIDPPLVPILDSLFFGTDSTFEIVTWNIQNFPKEDMITADYVVQIIMAIDADVFALQEIESSSYFDFDYVVDELQEIDSLYNWDGYKANSDTYGNLAYIYKNDFVEVDSIYEIYQDDWYAFPRCPLVFELTYDEQELVIIDNHLKAGGDSEDEDRREEASQKLQAFIDSSFTDMEVILVGDLNDDISEPQNTNVFWNFISQPDNYLFTDMEIAEGSSSNWSYPGWPSHLDHILITNELFDEFSLPSAAIQTLKIDNYLEGGWNEYYENVSDHRPVGLKLYFE
ncbi:MAG: endonuclease/exonuclease/phosphatase family protein [Candidatus Cloacimonetes bacterium]|nr:endonuclease/exonuclease/phosphatase family protein [Candidatus Cloacimonadota bacterium]MBL7149511.1 endonuclease/exonuclease/phosphatase family protein [Candidatus Cloacimonadota bacterium]